MDPVVIDDPIRIKIEDVLNKAIPDIDGVESFHDVRIVPGKEHMNVIFDVVLRPEALAEKDEIAEKITEAIRAEGDNYHVIINFDQAFV